MIDRKAVRLRFARAAASYADAARLEAEVGERMLARLDYVKIAPRRVLDAGCGPGREARALGRRYADAELVLLDAALPMLRLARRARGLRAWWPGGAARAALCADLERVPLGPGTIGLAWSNMALHWIADPLAAIREFHRVLAPEGLLMFSTLGPDTLKELRAVAGATRVHAFADMHDLGDMLVAAGFADPVMDAERITLTYADERALLADLRASGQTCALAERPRGLAGKGFRAALGAGLAAQRRGGRLQATFEVLYGHAWKAARQRTTDGQAIVRFARAGR